MGKTVRELCDKAGLEGKYMNHSLKASSATRMFQNSVPEQVIKEITGHRSDCVKTYKKTNDAIREAASCTISGMSNIECKDEGKSCEKVDEVSEGGDSGETKEKKCGTISVCDMIKNVVHTRMEMRRKKQKKDVKYTSKVAKKLVKKEKLHKNARKVRNEMDGVASKFMIDLNLNVKVKK